MLPEVLLPATTALGTLDARGREKGICTGDEAAECIRCLSQRVESIGYKVVVNRGDYIGFFSNFT
jgi:biotin synthase